jgi:hypothetical protein
MQTSHPRDHIYSCLGLLDEVASLSIVPDYDSATTTRKVFVDATKKMLKSTDGPRDAL